MQIADDSIFCEWCGTRVDPDSEPPLGLKKIIIGIVAAIILIGGGVWAYFVLGGKEPGDAVVTATITPKHGTPIVDSCRVCVREIEHPTPQPKIIEEEKKLIKKDTLLNPGSTPHQKLDGKKPTNQKEKPSTTIYLQWGTLDGSLSYDNDATIKVTKQHTMYLKDAKQSTIVVCPGDELRQCRIRNGILGSFQIISKNGNRESVLDAHENLN